MRTKKEALEKQRQLLICRHVLLKKGQKVLAIDMDPQGNMTSGLGIDKDEVEKEYL